MESNGMPWNETYCTAWKACVLDVFVKLRSGKVRQGMARQCGVMRCIVL